MRTLGKCNWWARPSFLFSYPLSEGSQKSTCVTCLTQSMIGVTLAKTLGADSTAGHSPNLSVNGVQEDTPIKMWWPPCSTTERGPKKQW